MVWMWFDDDDMMAGFLWGMNRFGLDAGPYLWYASYHTAVFELAKRRGEVVYIVRSDDVWGVFQLDEDNMIRFAPGRGMDDVARIFASMPLDNFFTLIDPFMKHGELKFMKGRNEV